LEELNPARKAKRLPVVMTPEEVREVLKQLTGDKWLIASLFCGAGLRLMECLPLRVQDLDFSSGEILVGDGKGAKDRMTMLPRSLYERLQDYLRTVKTLHDSDLANGWGSVLLPDALDRNYPNAPKDWRWQWVFPQRNRWRNLRTEEEGRHHRDESLVQKPAREAVVKVGLTKRVSCHTFRLVRHAPTGERVRHPNGAGASGPQLRQDHHDLYPRTQQWRIGCSQPDRRLVTEKDMRIRITPRVKWATSMEAVVLTKDLTDGRWSSGGMIYGQ